MFKKLICWLLGYWRHDAQRGHDWRRLHKDEWARGVPIQFAPGSDAQVRICGRCQIYRLAKKRQRKGA